MTPLTVLSQRATVEAWDSPEGRRCCARVWGQASAHKLCVLQGTKASQEGNPEGILRGRPQEVAQGGTTTATGGLGTPRATTHQDLEG